MVFLWISMKRSMRAMVWIATWNMATDFWEVVRVAQYWNRAGIGRRTPDPSVIDFDGAEHVLAIRNIGISSLRNPVSMPPHPRRGCPCPEGALGIRGLGFVSRDLPFAKVFRMLRTRWRTTRCRCLSRGYFAETSKRFRSMDVVFRASAVDGDGCGSGASRPLSRAVSDVFRQEDWYYQNRGWGILTSWKIPALGFPEDGPARSLDR